MIKDYEAFLKAVADPTRARILKLLEGRELCVCQLMNILSLSQSTISGHLSILKNAGLVTDRKEGRWAHYSLCDRKQNPYVTPLLALLMSWLEKDAKVQADKKRLHMLLTDKSPARCN